MTNQTFFIANIYVIIILNYGGGTMKKMLFGLIGVILGWIMVISLSGCGFGVTPFAYVSYKLEGDQVAYYDSRVSGTHIFIFEDESKKPDISDAKYYDNHAKYLLDCDSNSMIMIRFKSILGVEDVGDTRASLAAIKGWYMVEVVVVKSSSIYSDEKEVYINDKKMEATGKNDSISDMSSIKIFHFEDHGLKRSNPNGKINDFVNMIEYK